jgi:hypothetical protein
VRVLVILAVVLSAQLAASEAMEHYSEALPFRGYDALCRSIGAVGFSLSAEPLELQSVSSTASIELATAKDPHGVGPLSWFGYGTGNTDGSTDALKLPILAVDGERVQVLWDLETGATRWLDKRALARRDASIILFDHGLGLVGHFVEIRPFEETSVPVFVDRTLTARTRQTLNYFKVLGLDEGWVRVGIPEGHRDEAWQEAHAGEDPNLYKEAWLPLMLNGCLQLWPVSLDENVVSSWEMAEPPASQEPSRAQR